MRHMLVLLALASLGCVFGCSSKDPLDSAAAPTTSMDNKPAQVPGKTGHRAPPLAGPNAGKDVFGGGRGADL